VNNPAPVRRTYLEERIFELEAKLAAAKNEEREACARVAEAYEPECEV
jgi:BMFP domain-containing protein YqiC